MRMSRLAKGSLRSQIVAAVVVLGLLAGPLPGHAGTGFEQLTLSGPSNPTLSQATSFAGRFTEAGVGIPNATVELSIDGSVSATTTTATDGTYAASLTFTTYGSHTVQATAQRGTVLETASPVLTVEVVPPLDETVATDVYSSSKFLYEGANPVQTGMAAGAIQPVRAAVLRGSVTDLAGQPIEEVRVTLPGHPELGETLSTDEGALDMAVNGGAPLVVRYQKAGFITAEREIPASWQDYSVVPEVTMVPFDSQVTTVVLTNSTTSVQVARGSSVTDPSGTRQATLLFPAGTRATMTLPNGSTSTITSGKVRATEFTVGDRGPSAMPAALPPESAYTYAVELSVDEAIAAGATRVNFTKAVPLYVENFLGFPVGTSVPVGYYDYALHSWVPEKNGRVIKILSVTSGKADLDVTGDGVADTGSALTSLGINDAEREKLATLYSVGTSLWRASLTHFSPRDLNFPAGLPAGASAAGMPEPNRDVSGQCEKPGSIIGCENQTLGEAIPIAGTPFFLRYDSSRVPGRKATNSLRVPLSGATLPPNLKRIDLEVSVAGKRFLYRFDPPSANLVHTFIWDGKDTYGRVVQGAQTATVRIGYVYQAVYWIPASLASAFGQPGTGPFTIPARNEITLNQSYKREIGGLFDAGLQALGGWTISAHHSYDPKAGTLHLGDGTSRKSEAVFPAIGTSAGNGAAGPNGEGTYTGEGGQATSAGLSRLQGVAMGADGSLFIADTGNAVVRRVSPDGVITRFAGRGNPPSGNGDGGPATSAELGYPTDLAVGADGNVYIVDAGDLRVRKVSPSGTISTFAGGGFPADGIGDGGPATSAAFSNPHGIAVGPGGLVFVADIGHDRVRRISPDGFISTVAGGGNPADGLGDGGQATQAKLLNPFDVVVAPEGTLFIADSDNDRVRRVLPDGKISTVAGTGIAGSAGDGGPGTSAQLNFPVSIAFDESDGSLLVLQRAQPRVRKLAGDGVITTVVGSGSSGFSGDLGPPARAKLNDPQGVAVGADGRLYVADSANFRVRRVLPSVQGFATSDFLVPSPDEATIYHFNSSGRHLRTLDALTGAVVYTFSYDTEGRLASISDDFGNVTAIERNASGTPTGVVSPFGLRTSLAVNSSGYLSSVANPASETVSLTYGEGGLLATLRTPRNHLHQFTYDSLGRLIKDEGPDGGFTELERIETATGFKVETTSALGRTTTYELQALLSGELKRITTFPSGARSEASTLPDGKVKVTSPDGTVSTTTLGPEPRWGLHTALPVSVTVTTPGGKSVTTTTQRTVTLSDPLNPLTLQTQTDSLTSNGKTVSRAFDKAALTITATSAAGRQGVITLNSKGRVIKERNGNLAEVNFTYDARGRVVSTTEGTAPDARTASVAYDQYGFVGSITNSLNQQTQFARDGVGRVLSSVLPDLEQIAFDYDDSGNLTSLTPPDKQVHAFDYTNAELVDRYRPPEVQQGQDPSTSYSYNLDRQPTQVALPGNRTTTFSYDSFGRLSSTGFSRGTLGYTYDSASRLSQITAPGSEAINYSYDGLLLTGLTTAGTGAGSVSYGYNSDLLVNSRSINGGAATSFSYDSDGLTTAAGSLSLAWDATNGYLNSTTLGSATTSNGYNNFGEVTSTSASYGATSLSSISFTRDKLGRVTEETETVQGTTSTYGYSYDFRGRLTDVTKDGSSLVHYDYDTNGNRTQAVTSSGTTTGTYDAQDRMTAYGANTYTYYDNGELRTKANASGTTTYTYDELGNLTTVALPGSTTIDYQIDGLGRRVGKKVNASFTKRFLYGTGLQPVAELDASGTVVSTFFYVSQAHVPDYMTKAGATYRVVTDHLGSPRLVVNTSTGAIAQRIDYDTFGNVTSDTNPGFQPFGFAGGLYDSDTGLLRFGARDYDPEIGRWTAKDPIGFEGGDTNLYSYVGNDPINFLDPTGHFLWFLAIPIIIEVAFTVADAISTASTLTDECASGGEKALSVGLFFVGIFAPGGGYSTAGKQALKHGDELLRYGDEFVDLTTPARRRHILRGDSTGGGHLWPGKPNKSPFPQDWSEDRIIHEISDIATDPASVRVPGRGGSTIVRGARDGVDIEVIIRNGEIVTGYPTSIPRNPR